MNNHIDATIKFNAYFERSNFDSVKEFEKILYNTLEKITNLLANEKIDNITKRRLNNIKAQIIEWISEDYKQLQPLIDLDKQEWAGLGYEAYSVPFKQLEGIAIATTFDKLPKEAIKRVLDPNQLIMGRTLKENIAGLKNINERILPIISDGLMLGYSNEQITNNILSVYKQISHNQRGRLETLVRQTIHTTLTNTNNEVIKQLGSEADTVYYLAILDTRTTPYCARMNGTIWKRKKDESFEDFRKRVLTPAPKSLNKSPNAPISTHWNCRSTLLFTTSGFLDDFRQEKRTAVLSKKKILKNGKTRYKVEEVQKVDINISFSDWLMKQKKEYIIDYLGSEKKYNFMINHGLEVDDLLNIRKNRIFSLKELKEKYK